MLHPYSSLSFIILFVQFMVIGVLKVIPADYRWRNLTSRAYLTPVENPDETHARRWRRTRKFCNESPTSLTLLSRQRFQNKRQTLLGTSVLGVCITENTTFSEQPPKWNFLRRFLLSCCQNSPLWICCVDARNAAMAHERHCRKEIVLLHMCK